VKLSATKWEVHEAVLEADTFEDLPGKSQAAMLKAEQNRPNVWIVRSGSFERASLPLDVARGRGTRAVRSDSPGCSATYRTATIATSTGRTVAGVCESMSDIHSRIESFS
jgi:hypothetical protein